MAFRPAMSMTVLNILVCSRLPYIASFVSARPNGAVITAAVRVAGNSKRRPLARGGFEVAQKLPILDSCSNTGTTFCLPKLKKVVPGGRSRWIVSANPARRLLAEIT